VSTTSCSNPNADRHRKSTKTHKHNDDQIQKQHFKHKAAPGCPGFELRSTIVKRKARSSAMANASKLGDDDDHHHYHANAERISFIIFSVNLNSITMQTLVFEAELIDSFRIESSELKLLHCCLSLQLQRK
jgi:hypothetical protein